MEAGDQDAPALKRLRLDSGNRLYNGHGHAHTHGFPPPPPPPPPPPQAQPARQPPPPSSPAGPHHHHHLGPHGLPSPASSYPPAHRYAHHPPPSSLPPPDPRAYPEATPSRPARSPHQRPDGLPMTIPPPSISQDRISDYARPPVPPRSIVADAPAASPASVDVYPPPTMDHGGHLPRWHPAHEHRAPNGAFSNGYARVVSPDHIEQKFPTPPLPPSQQYTPPVSSYTPGPNPQPPYMGANAAYTPGGPRRKQVRATQACNNCRQRKQKCDELKPCSFCKDNNFECQYKDVPPPKQDRSMMQLQETANELKEAMAAQTHLIGQLIDRVQSIEMRLDHTKPGEPSPFPSGHRSSFADQSGSRIPSQPVTQSEQLNGMKRESSLPIHSTQSATPIHPSSIKAEIAFPRERSSSTRIEPVQSTRPATDANGVKPKKDDGLEDNHSTPAHRVLQDWDCMKRFCDGLPYFEYLKAKGIPVSEYLMRLETDRGIFRVWGVGQGLEAPMDFGVERAAAPASHSSDTPSPPAVSPAIWGQGEAASPIALGGHVDPEDDSPGGLGLDGRLKLDNKTLWRLYESYMENIHVLQPILNASQLRRTIKMFGQSYGPEVMRSHPYVGIKRKRPGSNIDETSTALDGSGTVNIHRSIGNAIVLLVLALGKVSEWKRPLPRPCGGTFSGTLASGAAHVATPPAYHDFSDDHGAAASRRRNIDILPGMAYYAIATDIIGNQFTGLTVMHAQAYILAGLYCAQFGHVLESWTYISRACQVCTVSIRSELPNITRMSVFDGSTHATGNQNRLSGEEFRLDALIHLYWGCFQLESDLLAELSTLAPSPISGFQEEIAYPSTYRDPMTTEANPVGSAKKEETMLFYSCQIYLRGIINSAHNTLYNRKARNLYLQPEIKVPLHALQGIADAAIAHMDCLVGWRNTLRPGLAWDDSDPPSTSINHARLRGKYYGGIYMILRPYLHILLHQMAPPAPAKASSSSNATSPAVTPDSGSGSAITPSTSRATNMVDYTHGRTRMLSIAAICVEAAIQSTIAFDRVGLDPQSPYRPFVHIPENRFIVTNPFGTLHAQFGNMIVLASVFGSRLHEQMPSSNSSTALTRPILSFLFRRTIKVLRTVDCPALEKDAEILENVRGQLRLFP